jgi:hypothetical protein
LSNEMTSTLKQSSVTFSLLVNESIGRGECDTRISSPWATRDPRRTDATSLLPFIPTQTLDGSKTIRRSMTFDKSALKMRWTFSGLLSLQPMTDGSVSSSSQQRMKSFDQRVKRKRKCLTCLPSKHCRCSPSSFH